MPNVKYTVDDVNPMISYEPSSAWLPGNKTADPEASNYSNNGTFTVCQQNGATATFNFNGTGVAIYGAKRSNHGFYSATLDGVINLFDGHSPNSIYNQSLFEASSLQDGPHTPILTNTETSNDSNYLDVDYVIWTVSIGEDFAPPTTTYQDGDPSFSYEPSDAWSTQTNLLGFENQSGHQTTQANASVTLTFNGEEVQIYGSIGPSASPFLVKVDNGTVGTFNGTRSDLFTGVMLYETSDLGPGQHTVTLMNKPNDMAQNLSIDYAVVTDNTKDTSSGTSGLSSGAIVGVVVGAVVGLAAVALIIFFWRRGKNADDSERNHQVSLDLSSPLGIHPAVVEPFISRPSMSATGPNPEGLAMSSARKNSTSLTNPWSSDPSSFYRAGHRNPMAAPLMLVSSVGDDSQLPTSSHSTPSTSQSEPRPRRDQPTVPLASANQSIQHLPAEVLRSTRMFVEGREQDFGPALTTEGVLPPNYEQAVEPFHQRS
ncbi:uncharacterized protein BT62DRAFT_142690 [Guyanagaster necrorhizus]|uniref:Transmembrane protein n=1 Tax=Guyanagaster necrorhizus TaxID=856835 RepID=A0A9P7VTR8_9AGAR|nr:uncharacterized protein BT62DRAFT_142690 [Guyanagaster necrorhizus MCA 3950]KAG7445919.1 hypothetical protein BT62DRAFT_142690 [Guyanagaster necrorhizus MCA 3950]